MDGHHTCLGAVILFLAGALSSASAAVIPVGGACTLVDAIAAANTDSAVGGCPAGSGPDSLVLSGDVTLDAVVDSDDVVGDTGLPPVLSSITVEGAGFTIQRDPDAPPFRIFLVGHLGSLTLRDVTVRRGLVLGGLHGLTAYGGAILVPFYWTNAVVLDHATLTENSAPNGGGGALYAAHSVTIRRSSISGNHAAGGGGLSAYQAQVTIEESTFSANTGTWGGGILLSESHLHLINSTISGNLADKGGGIFAFWAPGGTQVEARHSSIVGNTANVGSGVYYDDSDVDDPDDGIGFLALAGSIVAGNTGPGGDCGGPDPVTDGGGNFAGDGTCGPGFAPIALATGVDPTLADNGGPTATHALPEGSPAIDATGDCGLVTDQRGVARDDGRCDSGAVEFAPILINGNFSSGRLPPWKLHTSDWAASAAVNQGALQVDVGPGGLNVISQLYQKDLALDGNTTYALRFDASSSLGGNLRVRLLQHVAPFENYGLAQNVNIQTATRAFEIVFTTTPGDKVDARLSFLLQFKNHNGFAGPDEVYVFDNISLVRLNGHRVANPGWSPDIDEMPRRGFQDSLSTEPRLNIWHQD